MNPQDLLTTLWTYASAHHAQLAEASGLALAAVNLSIKVALWIHPIKDWVALAEKRPRLAALLRFSLALGIDPVAVLQAAVDALRNEASKGTVASMNAVRVSTSSPLISPRTPKSERATLPPPPASPSSPAFPSPSDGAPASAPRPIAPTKKDPPS